MPIEPENTAESSPEAEERPLAPVDEIMSTKGLNRLQRAIESEGENETQDEPEVVAEEAEEATAEDVVADSNDEAPEADGGGDSEDEGLVEEVPDGPVNTASEVEPSMHLWGVCTLTFYCGGPCCCGQWAGGPTASGVMPTPNHTVACGDLPFGTRLMIESTLLRIVGCPACG